MSAVDDVVTYLTAQALVGGVTGWTAVRRRMADTPEPDKVVVVAEDGGPPPEMKTAGGIGSAAVGDAGVLVTVRAGQWDSDVSKQKALDILTLLHGKRNIQLVGSGTVYYRVRALTPEPIFAGFDDTGRPRHTVGFRLLAALT